jgi:hypothetical protein
VITAIRWRKGIAFCRALGLGVLVIVSEEFLRVRIGASESWPIHTVGRGVRIVQIAAGPK